MSDDMQKRIDQLQAENVKLNGQIQNMREASESLIAQADASKLMLQESINSCLASRTENSMLSKKVNALTTDLEKQKKQIESLNHQLSDATAKLTEPKPANEPMVPAS